MARYGLSILVFATACASAVSAQPAGRFTKLAPPAEKKGPNSECKKLAPGLEHVVRTSKETGAWGYMADGLVPAAIIRSGDVVNLTIPSAAGTLLYGEMIEDDEALEGIFRWDEAGPAVATRGAFGGGEGQSWNVGPIHVCSAKPGDILQVDFLSLKPHFNPKDGTAWGVLTTSQSGLDAAGQKDIVTAFQARLDKNNTVRYFMPDYTYTWQSEVRETTCVPDSAEYPNTLPEGKAQWANEKRDYMGLKVPCIDGKQAWDDLTYPGIPVNVPYHERQWGLASRFIAKPSLHVGFAGVAPATGHPVSGDLLGRTGGLLNQKRMTQDTSLFLPVEVKGAQLFLGKGHFAAADGLVSGGALEGNIDAQIRVTVHPRKDKKTPKWMRTLQGPVIETGSSWVVPSVAPADEGTGTAAAANPASLDEAASAASRAAASLIADFYEMEASEVRRVMAFGVDFGVSSLVSGRTAVHAVVDRASMDFFDTASDIETAIKAEEEYQAAPKPQEGGEKKRMCECQGDGGGEGESSGSAQAGAGSGGADAGAGKEEGSASAKLAAAAAAAEGKKTEL